MNDVTAHPSAIWWAVPHAHLRFRGDEVVVGAPESADHVALPAVTGVRLWEALHTGGTLVMLADTSTMPIDEVVSCVRALVVAGIVTDTPSESSSIAFHDALMHARSRGRTDEGFGQRTGAPAHREPRQGTVVALPAIAPDDLHRDAPFADVVGSRTTARSWSTDDLTLGQLAEFLWRAGHAGADEPGHLPYPYAGPVDCHVIAVAAGRIDGLAPALYTYGSRDHALRAVTPLPTRETGRLPIGDYLSTVARGERVGERHPPALMLVLSDLGMMASAYDGIAYANILKTTGVILGTASLSATAMGLGSTILGLANGDDFTDIYGASLPHLRSTGELALGVPQR